MGSGLISTTLHLPNIKGIENSRIVLTINLFSQFNQIYSGRVSLCYNAAIMNENFRFANNNNSNDNDDGYVVGRSLAG